MLKRNTKTDSENDKNYLTVEEFNAIRRMDFPKDFWISWRLDSELD